MIAYCSFLLLLTVFILATLLSKTLNFRLITSRKRLYFFKWLAFFIELIFLPLLLNIVHYGICQYTSSKDSVIVVNLNRDFPLWGSTVMWVSVLTSLILGVLYIAFLAWHLYREKISNMLNEEYIRKKEIEFVVNISEMWVTRHFYLFSSFKSDFFKMYHRVLFNLFQLILVVFHAVLPQGTAKIGLIMALFAIFLGYIMLTRPYRCQYTNLLVFLLAATQLVNTFVLLLKISGLKSALFVDTYYYYVLILINGFGWFLVLAAILLALALKGKWPVDRDIAKQGIAGQELAIVFIKRARKFRKRIVREKVYGEPERKEHDLLLE